MRSKKHSVVTGLSLLLGLALLLYSVIGSDMLHPWINHHLQWLLTGVAGSLFILMGLLGLRTRQSDPQGADQNQCLQELQELREQLVVQEKMAQTGLLTAGIAHEIKNPLNFITNFSKMNIELVTDFEELIKPKLPSFDEDTKLDLEGIMSDLKTNAEKIHSHGKRAESIVMNMLVQTRADAELEKIPVNINDLLEEFVNLAYHGLRATDNAFNIKIEKTLDPSVGTCDGISQSLGRVFLNISNNGMYAAYKRSLENPDHKPIISVTTKGFDDYVVIRIRDNGQGIKEEHLKKIFQPFFTTKPKGQGTGLGLSICYDIIVKTHQGELKVESEVQNFTEFMIQLPRKQIEKGNL